MNDRQSPVRTLVSAADGRVIPLGELYDTRYAKGAQGDGFAVLPPAGVQRLRLSAENAARALIDGAGRAGLYAPADGVVTALDPRGRLTLRTCDAVEVCVVYGASAHIFTGLGERLSSAQQFGVLGGEMRAEGCAALVIFPHTERITELQIEAGARRGGQQAATYRAVF